MTPCEIASQGVDMYTVKSKFPVTSEEYQSADPVKVNDSVPSVILQNITGPGLWGGRGSENRGGTGSQGGAKEHGGAGEHGLAGRAGGLGWAAEQVAKVEPAE